MRSRARITVPDIVYVLASLAILGALYPVLADGIASNVGELDTGTLYLIRLVLPMAILILFSMVYVKATAGVK